MKHMVRYLVCLATVAGLGLGAMADGEEPVEPEIREGQLWTYDASTRKLTEIVEEGVTPWTVHINANGVIDSTSAGANPVVDLRTQTLPDGVPEMRTINEGTGIFRQRTTLVTVYLPDTCTNLVGHTFYNCSNLENVSFPQNPGGNFTASAHSSGGTFNGTKVREAVLPRTMKSVVGYMFKSVSALTRVDLPDDVETMDATAFQGCSGIREVVWHNWVTNVMNKTVSPFPNVSALNCRHIVPGGNPDWARFIWDPTKVTQWAKCSANDRTAYFTRYGEDAAAPFGISATGAAGFNRGYIVTDGALRGVPVGATVADVRTGSVSFDPAPDDGGFYPVGTEVRISFTPAEGCVFVHWEGTTDGIDVNASEITVTADRLYALLAVASSSSYMLDGDSITDGCTTLSCSGGREALVITGAASALGTIDLSKPIVGGGAIIGIGASAFGSTKGLTRVVLPATLAEIGATAFPAAVTEIVWNGSPIAWADSTFGSFTAKKTRFVVPANDADWAAVACDAAKVTAWSALSRDDKFAYFTNFGADAAEPVGIGAGGGISGVWIVPRPAGGLRISALPRQFMGARPTPAVTTADGEAVADVAYAYVGGDAAGLAAVVATVTAGEHEGEKVVGYYTVASVSHTDTYTWKVTADGDWEDAANWQSASGDAGYPQMPGDSAVLPKLTDINETSYKVTVNERVDIASLTVGGDGSSVSKPTLEFKTYLATNTFASVTVKKDGTITHFGPNKELTQRLILKVSGDLTVEPGGAIEANDVGSTAVSSSPNPGTGRCFGHHAGETDNYQGWGAGRCYGSIRHPVDYGAGAYITSAAAGAGSIYLEVAGRLQLQSGGTVSASPKSKRNAAAAPAGGSIWLKVNELAGEGIIIAAGAKDTGSGGNWCGSGGRVAIYLTGEHAFSEFAGTVTTVNEDSSATMAAGGTVYVQESDEVDGLGTLIVDGRGRSVGFMTLLSKDVIGADEPFGSVILRNAGKLRVMDGTTLKVVGGLSLASKAALSVEPGGALEFVGGGETTFTGASLATIDTLICTNAGKTIRFGTAAADKLTVAAGKNLILRGTEESPVTLASAVDGTPWQIAMNANPGVVEVEHVAVKDSDASSGAPMLAIDSQNLGGNSNWGFSRHIVPGETITWTGGLSTKWDAVENWDLGRAPVETDAVSIPAVASEKYPVLPSGTYLYNRIEVGTGASFTLSGCELTVTNNLAVAGALVFSDNEPLYLAGDADFTGGSVTAANGTVYLTGAGDQRTDFGNCTLNKLIPQKPSGNVSFGAHGFTAANFALAATAAIRLTFAAGQDYAFDFLSLSSVGADRLIALVSSVPGTAWRLRVTASGQSVASVSASDSDASAGDAVMAGTKSEQSGCTNWDTETDTAVWVGGATGDFTDPTKWSSGAVPGPMTLVTVSAGDGETVTVTVPAAAEGTVIKGLTVYAGAGGKATFAADAPITIADTMTIRENGVVELNAFDDDGIAPNVVNGDVDILSGGTLSHTGPNAEQSRKLHLRCLGTFTVHAGGAVNVNYKGYSPSKGPGCANRTPYYAATASHWAGSPGTAKCYGSIRRPSDYGSGCSGSDPGGEGAGAIRLEVPGSLVVDGTISASTEDTSGPFRGSGGSVWLDCGVLSGGGQILAHGAKWTSYGTISSSGGRIAVYQSATNDTTSFTGTMKTITSKCADSACGTIYLQDADDADGEGTLIVDNQNVNSGSYVTVFGELMTDLDRPFGEVIVRNRGTLSLYAGMRLAVTKGIRCETNGRILSAADTVIEFTGTNDAVFAGYSSVAIESFICTNAEKTIRFGTDAKDMLVVGAGKTLKLSGADADHPLVLEPLSDDPTAVWKLNVHADAVREFTYLAVSNSNASAGTSLMAIDSEDRGGNTYWSFTAPIHPDDPIRWTGAASTDWADVENWDLRRAPVTTDRVYIDSVGEEGNYPVLASGTFAQNKVYVASGAKLTLSGATLTVSNEFNVAGSLVFAGAETLHLLGDADFTGGAVTAAGSFVRIEGETVQRVNLGDCVFRSVEVAKDGGAVVFAGGCRTDVLRCVPTVRTELRFADGVLFDVKNLTLIGGSAKLLTLTGDESGDVWRLRATADGQTVAGVVVSGCNASSGATVYAGTTSENAGSNENWDFTENRGIWVGGADGSFMEPSNWATGVVPGPADKVIMSAGDGEIVKATIPSGEAASVGSLTLVAGVGGKATLVANAPLGVAGDVEVRANGVLELNCFADGGEAPNAVTGDVVVRDGGRITHAGPAATENAKLHLAIAGDLTVEAGGTVDADGKGYAAGKGPGCTTAGSIGAAHAGKGYNNGAQPYGSVFCPTNWGSGNSSGCGGGAVHLDVTGTLRVDGRISADGGVSGVYAGAGGSVWIECGTIVGSGVLSVTEGRRPVNTSNRNDCTSSGGRMAVHQRTGLGFAAFPVTQMLTSWLGSNAAGTICLQDARSQEVYVTTGTNATYDATQKTSFPMAADGDMAKQCRNVSVTVGPRAQVELPYRVDLTVRDLALPASSVKLFVNASALKIRSMRHRDGRKWYKPLSEIGSRTEKAGKTVIYGGTELYPGTIEWVGGVDGTVLIVR